MWWLRSLFVILSLNRLIFHYSKDKFKYCYYYLETKQKKLNLMLIVCGISNEYFSILHSILDCMRSDFSTSFCRYTGRYKIYTNTYSHIQAVFFGLFIQGMSQRAAISKTKSLMRHSESTYRTAAAASKWKQITWTKLISSEQFYRSTKIKFFFFFILIRSVFDRLFKYKESIRHLTQAVCSSYNYLKRIK